MWLFIVLAFTGCTTPTQRIELRAQHYQFSRELIKGTAFSHVIYRNITWRLSQKNQASSFIHLPQRWHIYLEGDGTPFITPNQVSPDPTPRQPLALDLMSRDNMSSLYLGRPCYYGQADTPPCTAALWTTQRYSLTVVNSMVAALLSLPELSPPNKLVFIGHSGGATLAMLLAERLASRTRAVVTVAGNLNPRAWTLLHGYSALHGSLNPALRPALPPHIVQRHYAGGSDSVIPVEQIVTAAASQFNAPVIIEPDYTHVCCWLNDWPVILQQLNVLIKQQGSHH